MTPNQGDMEIYALKFKQHSEDIYLFSMPAKQLIDIVEIVPNSATHPDFPQRSINDTRCKDIAKYVSGAEQGPRNGRLGYLPPSLVLNLYETVRVEAVDSVNQSISLVKFKIPNDGNKHAYCLDGQHRLFAFDQARTRENLAIDPELYSLPVAAFLNKSRDFISDLFLMINTRQEPVASTQIFTVSAYLHSLDQPEQRAYAIIEMLNNKQGGPLQDKVQIRPEDKGRLIKSVTLKKLLKRYLETNAMFGDPNNPISDGVVAELLNNYLEAWKRLYPDAWGDRRHVLTKSAGWEVMFGVLKEAYRRLRLYKNGINTVENWEAVISYFKNNAIALQDPFNPQTVQNVVIDWTSDSFRQYSSGRANIERFVRAFNGALDNSPPPD